ncbi:hypothetical protein LZZ85_16835 [Terrimonas sp. NA20]|uniref:Lipocalin-like domain-containing protein n=1 Tax=Terrimonas ginsenosidimutans TaxID=2908004 RepID=A0ABS9KUG1_9BACT|nr:hypothetical protein [Terrimonas ginsenosidimutans]MCG2615965.1 hypothetical protein [Terrimonas ginsenosidimutans]
MKTKLLLSSLLLLFFLPVFQSCKKDKEPNRTQLLTARPWRMISGVVIDAAGNESDVYSGLKSCEQDNEFTFTTDLVHEHREGATKCHPADPQTIYFASWKFLNNESIVEISAGSQRLEYRIVSLTATEFVFDVLFGTSRQHVRMIH